MKKPALYWQILIAFILAIVFGLFLKNAVPYVEWMGTIFIKALKMIIIPLILSSIISGITQIGDAKNLGRLGLKTMTYYLTTSIFALLTGLVLVNLFKPGVGADLGLQKTVDEVALAQQSFGSTLMNIIPENIIEAMVQNQMLSIIFFALLFGFFITRTSEKTNTLLSDFFSAFFEVMMKITMFIIQFTPLGIFGIVAKVVAEQENLLELFSTMGQYMLVVILALAVHSMIILPLLIKLIGKSNPWLHFKAMREALITAFSTSSSSATLPLTLDAVENRSGVSNKVTSFTLPLGATINMDGTALYELVAAIFIAQAYGIELTFGQQIIVVLTGLLASIGAAGIPMAGLVMISVVLTAVGLPLEGIGLILSVDRILDMFRTTVNVWSDSCGAVIIAKTEGETLVI
ncbi:MAG: dicarboxylate/amino acid:cation symporter [Salinivirgaceae bacterium]